jgi:putative copper resistance protein D
VARWAFDPVTVAMLLIAATAYNRASAAIAIAHPRHPFPPARRMAFFAGLTVVATALLSPVHAYADDRLVVHMVQHLLLTSVAAPLLVLGAPLALALRASRPDRRRRLLRVLHGRTSTALGHPVVAWAQFAATMWATHFSGFFEAATEHGAVHAVEHAIFLASAIWFWWPVLGDVNVRARLSYPLRLLYVAVAMPQNTFLALAILSAERTLYAHYPLRSDQRQAGGVMWVAGDLVLLAAVLLLTAAWARHEERETARRERVAAEPRGS